MNPWDILIVFLLALALTWALRTMKRKRGSGCSGNCADCKSGCGADRNEKVKK